MKPKPAAVVGTTPAVAPMELVILLGGINHDGQHFPRGAALPADFVDARNCAALLRCNHIQWQPHRDDRPQPRPLPPPVPSVANPQVIIAGDENEDVVERWKLSLETMTIACGGNVAAARDLLLRDEEGSKLYARATRVDCERQKIPFRRIPRL
jgi:hypothetical protein